MREVRNVARRFGCVRGSTRHSWIVSFVERGKPGSTAVLALSGTARTVTDTRAMHSLKELRAENAAKRLSSDRTAEDADGISSLAAAPIATPASAAPRAGRTLAPIGSTGSLPPPDAAAPAEPTAGDDDAQQREDREARRRRRLRRRREREQRENAGGDDNSKVSVDDNTTAVSGTSQTSTSRVDEDEEGGSTPTARDKGAPLEGRAGRGSEREKSEQVGAGPPRSRHPPAAAEKVAGDDKKVNPEKNGSDLEKPLSARGAPPKEKPKKKLTPLEARRARIEQQKREEVSQNHFFLEFMTQKVAWSVLHKA